MDAAETIEHFSNMGVLDKVLESEPVPLAYFDLMAEIPLNRKLDVAWAERTGDNKPRPLLIIASAYECYASRCMRDFRDSPYYWASPYGIYAITSDGVPVSMAFTELEEKSEDRSN